MNALATDKNDNKVVVFSWKHYFQSIWDELFLLVRYNLMFLLCCIPVVTIPAAITAMHNVFVRIARGEKPVFKTDAFHIFKREFGRSLLIGVLSFGSMAVALVGFVFYVRFAEENITFMVPAMISGSIALLVFLMSFYVFTMLAIFDLPLKAIIKNAYLLTILNIKYSLCAGVYVLTIAAIGVLLFPLTVPLSLMVLYSIAIFTSTYFSYYGIKKFILMHRDAENNVSEAIKTSIADFATYQDGGDFVKGNLQIRSRKVNYNN